MTIGAVYGLLAVWPGANIGERLDTLGMFGAALIVAGSVMAALGSGEVESEPVALD